MKPVKRWTRWCRFLACLLRVVAENVVTDSQRFKGFNALQAKQEKARQVTLAEHARLRRLIAPPLRGKPSPLYSTPWLVIHPACPYSPCPAVAASRGTRSKWRISGKGEINFLPRKDTLWQEPIMGRQSWVYKKWLQPLVFAEPAPI